MARDQVPARRRTITTTVETTGEGDALRGRIRKRLAEHMGMNAEAYAQTYWEAVADVPGAKLLIMKKVGGYLSKVGELTPGEMDAKDVESWVVQEWQDGSYQLQPEIVGRMYGPASKVFRFGTISDERPPRIEQDTIDAEINAATKRLGHVAALAKLKDVVGEKKGDDMDMAGVAALVQAQMVPLMKMIEQAETRAARAEERAEKLMDRMLDARSQHTQVQAPLFAEILKTAIGKPEVLSLLLNPNPMPERNWLDTVREIAQELAPMAQGLLKEVMARGGVKSLPAIMTGAGGTDKMSVGGHEQGPTPTAPQTEGDGTMPMPLNEEQEMARNMLVEFVVNNDFANAHAVLASFPGFVPGEEPGTAIPLGEFLISRIDPAVNPKVYLPQLATLIPDLRKALPQAEAFIKHIQNQIVADDEAARRQGARPTQGPLPTRGDAA